MAVPAYKIRFFSVFLPSLQTCTVLLQATSIFLCVTYKIMFFAETNLLAQPIFTPRAVDEGAKIYETAVFYVAMRTFFIARVWSQSWQIYVYNLYEIRLRATAHGCVMCLALRTHCKVFSFYVCSGFIICTRDSLLNLVIQCCVKGLFTLWIPLLTHVVCRYQGSV